jgi:ubiquinone/menaquinone biosynthesis C-methylase UbiE
MNDTAPLKQRVRDFWDETSCGERYASGESEREYYETHARRRFELEPYIHDFARFKEGEGKDVLEIGVGMGADHLEWAKARPKSLIGIDLTLRAVEHTRRRLELFGFHSDIRVADAENLPFANNSFDVVYSWGVLHHSPDTKRAIDEVYRVLRPGGIARIAIYHKYSLVGYMLWIRYALLTGRPFCSLSYVYAHYLESPGTKAFSSREAREMSRHFSQHKITPFLSFGDLLEGDVGQRHRGVLLRMAKAVWPRWLLKRICKRQGLYLSIEVMK